MIPKNISQPLTFFDRVPMLQKCAMVRASDYNHYKSLNNSRTKKYF